MVQSQGNEIYANDYLLNTVWNETLFTSAQCATDEHNCLHLLTVYNHKHVNL